MYLFFFAAHGFHLSCFQKEQDHSQLFINLCTHERENYQMDGFGDRISVV